MATRQKNLPGVAPIANGHDPEIEVKVDDDGAEIQVETVDAPPAPPTGDTAAELAEARRQLAESRAEAERLRAERAKDQSTIVDSRVAVLDSVIQAKTTQRDDLKRQIREAKEAGDYEKEVDLTSDLQVVNAELRDATRGKDNLSLQIEESKASPQQQGDPLEKWFIDQNIGEPSRQWLRAHRDYATDPRKGAKLSAAHYDALDAGHAANTPGYFTFIEEHLGLTAPQPVVEQPAAAHRQAVAPAAPVSRQAGMGGGQQVAEGIWQKGSGQYSVSKEVAEMIAVSGISAEEYIKQAIKLRRGSDGQLH